MAASQVAGMVLYNGINVWLARGCAVPQCRDGPVQKGAIMLVTTKEMLLDAKKNHYGVGAFNVENLEFVMAVLKAAEETKSPVIMQTTPGTIKAVGLDYFYGMVKAAAERTEVTAITAACRLFVPAIPPS